MIARTRHDPTTARHARSTMLALAALLALASSACASEHYRVLRSERDHPRLATLLDASAHIPSKTVMIEVDRADGRPVRMAVRERGSREADRLVVLVHGFLTDSRTWRYLEGSLGQDFDLLAVDLVGCGRSDKPDPDDLGPTGYSPTAQARRVLRALRAHLAERGDDVPVTLVAQSYGGLVSLRMLGAPELKREYADVLGRIEQVVLIAPAEFAIEKAYPVFKEIANLGDAHVFLGDLFGVLDARCAEFVRYGMYEREGIATREGADLFAEVLADTETRHAAQAILRQAVPFIEEKRPDWDEIEPLTADYANIDKPLMLVWGTRDTTLPLSMGYKLQREIPGAKLTVLEKTMHTVQGERPRLCARLIREFVAESGADLPEIRRIDPERIEPEHVAGVD